MTGIDGTIGELFAACERSAVHLEMRDAYSTEDPVFQDWRGGISVDPASRWREWFDLVSSTTARGVEIRRARVVSEPISTYIRYEYEITDGLNIAAGTGWLSVHPRTATRARPGGDPGAGAPPPEAPQPRPARQALARRSSTGIHTAASRIRLGKSACDTCGRRRSRAALPRPASPEATSSSTTA